MQLTLSQVLVQLISKKFLVWAVATVAMFANYIQADAWMIITASYIGVQGILDWKRDPTTQSAVTTASTTVAVSTTSNGQEPPVVVLPKQPLPGVAVTDEAEEPTEEEEITRKMR